MRDWLAAYFFFSYSWFYSVTVLIGRKKIVLVRVVSFHRFRSLSKDHLAFSSRLTKKSESNKQQAKTKTSENKRQHWTVKTVHPSSSWYLSIVPLFVSSNLSTFFAFCSVGFLSAIFLPCSFHVKFDILASIGASKTRRINCHTTQNASQFRTSRLVDSRNDKQ